MAWLSVDKDGQELIFLGKKPVRWREEWVLAEDDVEDAYELNKGTIKKIIGRGLTWKDEPVEINED